MILEGIARRAKVWVCMAISRIHTCAIFSSETDDLGLKRVAQPEYSPDAASYESFLVGDVKRQEFMSPQEPQEAIREICRDHRSTILKKTFDEWMEGCYSLQVRWRRFSLSDIPLKYSKKLS
jgi:hypothetical protein